MSKVVPIERTLHRMIKEDIEFCRTPDVAKLRYHGEPILVFLWDDMQDFKTMRQYLGDIDLITGYRTDQANCKTVGSYLPWYNLSDDWGKGEEFWPALCLEDPVDLEMCSDVPEYALEEPKQMKGKLIRVSLDTFRALEEYYDNEQSFSRCTIEVHPWSYNLTKKVEAYTWFNTLEDLFYYEAHENSYKLLPNSDITPFSLTKQGEYEMGNTQGGTD